MVKLIDQLIEQKYLKTPQIIKAFKKIERADFLPKEIIKEKGKEFVNQYNAPIPIGYQQTISQPLTVAFMLELLHPQKDDKILDIGSGSGWQTAILCQIAQKGFVYAIELIPELKDFGQGNLAKYNFKNVEFICDDGSKGLPSEAPFDKIIAAASAEQIPLAWSENKFEEVQYPGFSFVPLVEQ